MFVIMFQRGRLENNLTWSTKPQHLTAYRVLVDGLDQAAMPPVDQNHKRPFTPTHLEWLGHDLLGNPSWRDPEGGLSPSTRVELILGCLTHLALANDEHRRNAERKLDARTNLYPIQGHGVDANGNTIVDIGVVLW